MKSIKYLVVAWGVVVTSMFTFTSCELESYDYSNINSGMFPKAEDDAEALVTSCYTPFRANLQGGVFTVAKGVMTLGDLISDVGESRPRGWTPLLYCSYTVNNNNGVVDNLFKYNSEIGRMTLTIDRIENLDIKQDLKDKYIAEVKCARGFLAFLMYDYFGPTPIADLETLKKPLEEKPLPRLTEEQMREFIVTNLSEAANVLPATYNKEKNPAGFDTDYGRFTSGLCNMVLLKFYMKIGDWKNAEMVGRKLIDKNVYGYDLMDNYEDIFTLANEGNKEIIWAINAAQGIQEHLWFAELLPSIYPEGDGVNKWGDHYISWYFLEKHPFQEGDKRFSRIVAEFEDKNGVVHNKENDFKKEGNFLGFGAICGTKYKIEAVAAQKCYKDLIIYRYADAITLLAEAIVRNSNQVTPEALGFLNEVRKRAGLDIYQPTDINGVEDFLEKVLEERGHELWWEGCRRQDLIRHGKFIEEIKAKADYVGEKSLVNEHYYLLPLPQSAIDEGKGLVENNDGF